MDRWPGGRPHRVTRIPEFPPAIDQVPVAALTTGSEWAHPATVGNSLAAHSSVDWTRLDRLCSPTAEILAAVRQPGPGVPCDPGGSNASIQWCIICQGWDPLVGPFRTRGGPGPEVDATGFSSSTKHRIEVRTMNPSCRSGVLIVRRGLGGTGKTPGLGKQRCGLIVVPQAELGDDRSDEQSRLLWWVWSWCC